MPNTSNFNWPTPADTDLVKDGAAAIRNLGNGVDTSLVDLKGGTSGQILSKASNADMDFAFITPNVGDLTEVQAGTGISVASGTGPIPIVTNTVATEFDAKGDLVVGTGADTFARLAVGTNGHTLVANSSEATGLEWVAPAGGGKVLQVVQATTQSNVSITTGNFTDSAITATITPTAATSKILVFTNGAIRVETSSFDRQTSVSARIMRGATSIYDDSSGRSFQILFPSISSGAVNHFSRINLNFLDSPATTSATTYKVQYAGLSTQTLTAQGGSAFSSIILMEIGA